jgi:hypothetical protein
MMSNISNGILQRIHNSEGSLRKKKVDEMFIIIIIT